MDAIQIEKILFLDIETVPQTYNYQDLDEAAQTLFEGKNRMKITEEKTAEMVYKDLGGIQSEFGKIICISVGMVKTAAREERFELNRLRMTMNIPY